MYYLSPLFGEDYYENYSINDNYLYNDKWDWDVIKESFSEENTWQFDSSNIVYVEKANEEKEEEMLSVFDSPHDIEIEKESEVETL